jgi:hypothetical protein
MRALSGTRDLLLEEDNAMHPRKIALATVLILSASLAFAGSPLFTPNSVKYRDTGIKPAGGRSGSATITAQALTQLSGNTLLYVRSYAAGDDITTASPRGNLAQVQVKILKANSAKQQTDVYKKDFGPSKVFAYGGLTFGRPFQVQANVNAIDRKRNDVVTVTDTVRLAPDLTVGPIGAPSSVPINAAIHVNAYVSEINGDVGARTTCVLSVDGHDVDFIPNVWVNAGGEVACTFPLTLTTVGDHQLSIRADNVDPGDYDPGNNSATATVTAVDGRAAFSYVLADLHDWTFNNYIHTHRWYRLGGVLQAEDDVIRSDDGREQVKDVHGVFPGEVVFPVTVDFTESSGGVTFESVEIVGAAGTVSSDGQMQCVTDFSGLQQFSMCVDHAAHITTLASYSAGIDARYMTATLVTQYTGTPSQSSYLENVSDQNGQFQQIASDYVLDIKVNPSPSGAEFAGHISMDLPPIVTDTGLQTQSGSNLLENGWTEDWTQSYRFSLTGKAGHRVIGTPSP